MADLAVWQATIVDSAGTVQPNAQIQVLKDIIGQPPAACFANRDGTGPLGSQFNADGDGFVRFFVAGGAYQIAATLGNFSRQWRYVANGTAAEHDHEEYSLYTDEGANAVPRPWVSLAGELRKSPADFGGAPNTGADQATAILRAYNALVGRGGGELYFPSGQWQFSSFPVISSPNIEIRGRGRSAVLRPTSTTGDDIVITNQECSVRDIKILPTVRKTSGYAIKFGPGSFFGLVENVHPYFCYNGVLAQDCAETSVVRCHPRHLLGVNGFGAFGTTGGFGSEWTRCIGDNPPPITATQVPKVWAPSTAFNVGDYVFNNGNIYQCTSAGTSADVGAGPAGFPAGTTPESVFTGAIADGTAEWKFVSTSLIWFLQGSFAFSMRLNNCGALFGFIGYVMDDAINNGSSQPTWCHVNNLECDHNLGQGVLLNKGEGFYSTNSWIGTSLTSHGVELAAGFKGQCSLKGDRIVRNAGHGVRVNAGPKSNSFQGVFAQSNSSAAPGAFDGIRFEADASDFTVIGCHGGQDPIDVANNQAYAVRVMPGASDRYQIVHNLPGTNVTGGVLDGGTGLDKTVANNPT